jgi:cobalt-zinc-cadmium efflux system outer membrane protein
MPIAAALVGLLAGCTQYHSKPLNLQSTLEAFGQHNFSSPATRDYVRRYGGPVPKNFPRQWTLNELSVIAWHWSPTIAQLQARMQEQKGVVMQAGLLPNPRLSLQPRYAVKTLGNPWTLGFSFDIPIETAGKMQDKVRQAKAILAARGWDILQAAWQIRIALRRRLIRWQYARKVAVLKQNLAHIDGAMAKLISARFAGGAIARTQLIRIRLEYQRAKIAAMQAVAAEATAAARIAAVLNVRPHQLRQIDPQLAQLSFIPAPHRLKLRDNLQLAMANRLDVYALIYRYEAAEQNLKYQIALQYPNVHLGPGYQFNRGTDRYSFGVSVALPIFDRNQGNIAAAIARRNLIADRLTALQTHVITSLQTDMTMYRAAYHRWQLWRSLAHRQAAAEALERARFIQGAVSRIAWLDERLLLQTDLIYTAAARQQAELALTLIENDLQIPVSTDRSLVVTGVPLPHPAPGHRHGKKNG